MSYVTPVFLKEVCRAQETKCYISVLRTLLAILGLKTLGVTIKWQVASPSATEYHKLYILSRSLNSYGIHGRNVNQKCKVKRWRSGIPNSDKILACSLKYSVTCILSCLLRRPRGRPKLLLQNNIFLGLRELSREQLASAYLNKNNHRDVWQKTRDSSV